MHSRTALACKVMAQVDMVHIPYKGGGPMLTDLIGGQIPMAVDNLPSSMAHIQSGKIRARAVATPKRWPGAPDIPTVAESVGQPDVNQRLTEFGAEPVASTPEAFGRQIVGEIDKWKKIAVATGVKAE